MNRALLVVVLLGSARTGSAAGEVPRVHSICDLSQEFTFYMDGRFHRQYLAEVGQDARNWGSLSRLDLGNVNLLVLTGGHPSIPYAPEALERIEGSAREGGTVLLMADGNPAGVPGQNVAKRFDASLSVREAEEPLAAGDGLDPLLVSLASTRVIDPSRPPRSSEAEHRRDLGSLTLEYTDGTAGIADAIYEVYREVYPHLVAITGVEPSPGMNRSLLILPTGGGGFSSGQRIAIGAWWGGFPEQRYPMVELIGHEAGHSWVLPHAEPLWNEPIATYLGIQVGRRLGMPEAEATLRRQLEKGRAHDPEYQRLDPEAEGAARDLVWGKSYFVFEELEQKYGPGTLAKYFRAKRALVPADRSEYTMDDCVAVWSHALGEDLFGWFRSLAFDVSRTRTDVPLR